MRIAYNNYLDIATITASPAEATGYLVSNLQDQRLSTTWKAATTATQTITVDFLIAKSITTLALINHNIVSAATVTVSAGTTTATTAYSTVLTFNSNMMLSYISAQSYRYWKVVIAGNTSAAEVGRLWIGDYITVDPSSLINFNIIKKRSDNVAFNENRQKFASAGNKWRRFELEFPPTGETTVRLINTMFSTIRNFSSVIFCNFDTDRTYQIIEPCYCSIVNDINFSDKDSRKFSYSLVLEEEL